MTSEHIEIDLLRNGYRAVPIADYTQVNALLKLFKTFVVMPNQGIDFYSSHNRSELTFNLKVSESIQDVLRQNLQILFPHYDYFLGHFIVKPAHSRFSFRLHQDWSIVDEDVHRSIQVWIPLQPVGIENGTLMVLPHSHRFFSLLRSGSFGIPMVEVEELLSKEIHHHCGDAGFGMVYFNSTFHGSFPNPSEHDRLAVLVNLVQKGAQTVHYVKEDNSTGVYALSAEELLGNLMSLEKGIIPQDLVKIESRPLPEMFTSEINAKKLMDAIQSKSSQI